MLYEVKVWRLSRPYHDLKSMVNKPLLNSADGGVVYTSSNRDLASRLTQIQEKDDLVGLVIGEGFHGGGGGKRDDVWMCLHHVEFLMHHMTTC